MLKSYIQLYYIPLYGPLQTYLFHSYDHFAVWLISLSWHYFSFIKLAGLSAFPCSLALSRKFLKSCRLSGCLYGKRNLAKSQRYSSLSLWHIALTAACGGKWMKALLFLPLSQCDVGEQCAVRKGARIGKMCDCPRGAFCNFFLLKCLWASPDLNVASIWRERKNCHSIPLYLLSYFLWYSREAGAVTAQPFL